MKLQVNGNPHESPTGATLLDLLGALKLDVSQVAVERNRDVVPRATYANCKLHEGDRIEIVSFVGGG